MTTKPANTKKISLIAFTLVGILSSCIGVRTSLYSDVKEVSPGILEGYLEFRNLPSSIVLLPPPPLEGSLAYKLDQEISEVTLKNTDSARWEQARQDAILAFPEAVASFSKIVDIPINESNTPNLFILLRRTTTDAAWATYLAKKHYNRKRPFAINGVTPCDQDEVENEDDNKRDDGSYPSGHTSIGWAWALILTEIFPQNTNHLILRGREFGESRVVCNVHWQSDIEAGRFIGAATVARLHADPVFMADLEAAKREVNLLKLEAESQN